MPIADAWTESSPRKDSVQTSQGTVSKNLASVDGVTRQNHCKQKLANARAKDGRNWTGKLDSRLAASHPSQPVPRRFGSSPSSADAQTKTDTFVQRTSATFESFPSHPPPSKPNEMKDIFHARKTMCSAGQSTQAAEEDDFLSSSSHSLRCEALLISTCACITLDQHLDLCYHFEKSNIF